jgi:hypothetical protein
MKVVFATSTSTSSILSSRVKIEVEVQSRVIELIRLWMLCREAKEPTTIKEETNPKFSLRLLVPYGS